MWNNVEAELYRWGVIHWDSIIKGVIFRYPCRKEKAQMRSRGHCDEKKKDISMLSRSLAKLLHSPEKLYVRLQNFCDGYNKRSEVGGKTTF